jgi:microcystin-dependent protein
MDAYTGEIRAFCSTWDQEIAPQGWMICDGRLLKVTDYPELYGLIMEKFGGDVNAGEFALPNLMGRVIIGAGNDFSYPEYKMIGQTGGKSSVLLKKNDIPRHRHTIQVTDKPGNKDSLENHVLAAPIDTDGNSHYVSYLPSGTAGIVKTELDAVSLEKAGIGNKAHSNLMPYVVLKYIICVSGVYPMGD